MQTSSIGRQDNWARFMQLSSQARLRNDGLSGTAPVRSPNTANRVATVNAPQRTSVAAPLRQIPVSGSSYAPARVAVEARIVGGRFDAYA